MVSPGVARTPLATLHWSLLLTSTGYDIMEHFMLMLITHAHIYYNFSIIKRSFKMLRLPLKEWNIAGEWKILHLLLDLYEFQDRILIHQGHTCQNFYEVF